MKYIRLRLLVEYCFTAEVPDSIDINSLDFEKSILNGPEIESDSTYCGCDLEIVGETISDHQPIIRGFEFKQRVAQGGNIIRS